MIGAPTAPLPPRTRTSPGGAFWGGAGADAVRTSDSGAGTGGGGGGWRRRRRSGGLGEVDAKADRRGDGRATARRRNEARGADRLDGAPREGVDAFDDACTLHRSVGGDGDRDDDEGVALRAFGIRGLHRREETRRDDRLVGGGGSSCARAERGATTDAATNAAIESTRAIGRRRTGRSLEEGA